MRNARFTVASAFACTILALAGCEESSPPPGGGMHLADEPQSLAGKSAGNARDLANRIRTNDAATSALADRLAGSSTVSVSGLVFEIPEGWQSVAPSNQMRAAELKVGNCVAAISVAGGAVEDNVRRWEDQFVDDRGDANPAKVSEENFNGIEMTLVELDGTFLDGGMTGLRVERPGYAMLGAIIPQGRSSLFIKMTGPADEIDDLYDDWMAFVGSVGRE